MEGIDGELPTDKISTETCMAICTGIMNVKGFTYIPSARSESVSMTNSLSSLLHLRMCGSDFE